MSWDDVEDWRESWGMKKMEENGEEGERKGNGQGKETNRREKKKQKNGRKRERGRERGARPGKRRRRKVEKAKKIQQSGKSGGKVESFLAAVAKKYGTLNPITTRRPGTCSCVTSLRANQLLDTTI